MKLEWELELDTEVLVLLRGRRGLLLLEVVVIVLVVLVFDAAVGLICNGGTDSKPRIKRSTRSAAERLASSARVAFNCFLPYGNSGDSDGSESSFV